MTHASRIISCLLLSSALLTSAARAHHSFSAFDMSKEVTLQGVVASYQLQNPHAHMVLKVPGKSPDDKMAGTWDVEGAAANIMRRQGWTAKSVKVGDKITIVGHPLRTGDKGISLFYATLSDGTKLYQDIARPVAQPK